jgi:hypothetical protein
MPAVGRGDPDYEGFFIVQPDPETDGKIGVSYSD